MVTVNRLTDPHQMPRLVAALLSKLLSFIMVPGSELALKLKVNTVDLDIHVVFRALIVTGDCWSCTISPSASMFNV